MAKEFTQEDNELLTELGVEVETNTPSSRTPREERIIAGFEDIQRGVLGDSHQLDLFRAAVGVFARLANPILDPLKIRYELIGVFRHVP